MVIDADVIAREALAPGGAARRGVIDRFGPDILGPDGEIDRQALAAIVFADPEALADLNLLTHPVVREGMLARLAVEQDSGTQMVVLDIPLLVEGGRRRWPLDAVVVVDATAYAAMRRLVSHRGMSAAQASARIAAQVGRDERLAVADYVIDNSGDLAQLETEVDRAWSWLTQLRR